MNRHKIKRRMKRRMKKTSPYLLFRNNNETLAKNRFKNPYKKKQEYLRKSTKIKLYIIAFCLFSIAGIFLYNPFFSISNIDIHGNQRISSDEITQAVLAVGSGKKFLVLPGNSYLMFDEKAVQAVLESRFPFHSVIVSKIFPNKMSVIVEEKISTLIYDNGKMYSYLGVDGKIVENIRQVGEDEWIIKTKIVTSTNELGEIISEEKEIDRIHTPSVKNIILEMGDYPIVYDLREKQGSVNDVVLGAGIAEGIIKWFNILDKRTDIPFGYITVENELGDGLIKTREGWILKVKLDMNIEAQFEELQLALKQKINRGSLNYIDLRFMGKVYWQ